MNAAVTQPPSVAESREQLRRVHDLFVKQPTASAIDEGVEVVRTLCARGSADALLYHAALAARGFARPQSLDDALSLLKAAAAQGDARAQGQLSALGGSIDPAIWSAIPERVSHHAAPRIATVKNFLPREICSWLIKTSRGRLERAMVQSNAAGGAATIREDRTNSRAPTSPLEPDLVLQLVNLRIAALADTPLAHQEATNILHYAPGQEYRPHFDFIAAGAEAQPVFAQELRTIGQRAITVLVYLNEDYEGGETEFPRLDWRFRGKTGDALMFWNVSEAGERERDSLHAGKPVISGEKWLLSKWIRQRPVPLT